MIEIIPAIDIIDGQCVRLSQGDYKSKKVYHNNPLDVALEYEAHGIRRLHLVDLDGARSKHIVNHRVLANIATHTQLTIDFGGGIKSGNDLRIAFESGAAMVTIGSIAATQPQLFAEWLATYGSERIILGADAKDGNIVVNGWVEKCHSQLLPFLESYAAQGVTQVLCTDICCDGMLQGPSIDLYKQIMACLPKLHLIASGGVSCMADIERLNQAGIPAVVVGKALFEGRIALTDLKQFIP